MTRKELEAEIEEARAEYDEATSRLSYLEQRLEDGDYDDAEDEESEEDGDGRGTNEE